MLYSWKGDVGCVWVVSWRWGQTAILAQVLLTIAALLSPHLGWGYSTVGHWGPKALCLLLALTPASWLQLSVHLVILLFNAHLLPLFFRLFTQVHLLIDGSVEGQYVTHFPFGLLSYSTHILYLWKISSFSKVIKYS